MQQELLIDAIYINNSGGKILLDYLITELEKTDKKIFYLLDKRVEHSVPYLKKTKNKVIFLEASLLKRHRFYTENTSSFTSVFCFGNLPPYIKINATVYTYFHQPLFLEIPSKFTLAQKLVYNAKSFILKKIRRNTDFFLVQSDYIKEKLAKKYSLSLDKIKILPFYPPLRNIVAERFENTFVYISNATPHKNHIRLINAFCKFYNSYSVGSLTLTVSKNFQELYEFIEGKKKYGYPIINIGFVERDMLPEIYSKSEYLIFPSLAESFGLGLIESIEAGCKVIGADLPYTYEVCTPSIVFDPLSEKSIFEALEYSLKKNIKPTIPKISNLMDDLIALF